MDKHFDDAYLDGDLLLPRRYITAMEMGVLCGKHHCGEAATLLANTGTVDLRFFSTLATDVPQQMGLGGDIDPFIFDHPFGRCDGRTSLLSFETDILYPYVGTDAGRINGSELAGFFSFLHRKGIKGGNYDAVLVYTGAPHWCSTDLARAGVNGLWRILN